MSSNYVVGQTQSLCPRCLKKINACILSGGGKFYMVKFCPEHGPFRTIVWNGSIPMNQWLVRKRKATIEHPQTPLEKGCPFDCGLCAEHRQHTCTALIEVTQRCNLHCRFCFADSGNHSGSDPSAEQIHALYRSVRNASGNCNIQLSGGEPTLRDDLPQIVRDGKKTGFSFLQINTNGLRLARDVAYLAKLKSAGLDSVFLQFDGTEDSIYRKLRGRALLSEKEKAIENCGKFGIGVVLVPTLVPGVNVGNIGAILDFALAHIKAVQGVHFQPVSYFGRIPSEPREHDRITLAEVMDEIERQTNGRVKATDLKPPGCENSLCSFHGNFLSLGNGKLTVLSSPSGCCGKKAEDGAGKAKGYVSRSWSGRPDAEPQAASESKSGWDKILDSIRSNSFSVSGMAFQDVWNVDLNRVRDCCIHVVSPEGKLIPFCIYNITDTEGRSLYRNQSRTVT